MLSSIKKIIFILYNVHTLTPDFRFSAFAFHKAFICVRYISQNFTLSKATFKLQTEVDNNHITTQFHIYAKQTVKYESMLSLSLTSLWFSLLSLRRAAPAHIIVAINTQKPTNTYYYARIWNLILLVSSD